MRQWWESEFWNELFVLVELRIIEWRSCEAMDTLWRRLSLAAMAASTGGKGGNLHASLHNSRAVLCVGAHGYGRVAAAVAGISLLLMERCSEADA